MCATCGCGEAEVRVDGVPAHDHDHPHDHDHDHDHGPGHRVIEIETALLAKNDQLAGDNRRWLGERRITALNLMSSPGSGKTTLLVRTLRELDGARPSGVIEGDQETRLDAERIRSTGAPVVQINTGAGCHLDASMLARGLQALDPADGSLVFVENVGNLVCPALFDLGEAARVVMLSVTEGEDKPLKYPQMFAAADLVLITKVDLLPYVGVRLDQLSENCRSVRPGAEILPLSATTGAGMEAWLAWLDRPRHLDKPRM